MDFRISLIFFIMGQVFFTTSSEAQQIDWTDLIKDEGKTPVVTRKNLEETNTQDRKKIQSELARYDRWLLESCVDQQKGNRSKSCGQLVGVNIKQGDPGFQPEKIPHSYKTSEYRFIPKGSKVTFKVQCERVSGGQYAFYTRTTYTTPQGKTHNFKNPYNGQTKCLTSPGQYLRPMPPHISEFFYRPKGHARDKKYSFKTYAEFERHPDFDTPEKRFRYQTSRRTLLSPVAIATSLSQWHVVGDTKGYAGAQMPYSIWLNNTGYAFHAGTRHTPVTGVGASSGCFRLREDCARGLFNLVRRVGTNNTNVLWMGYKASDGNLCDSNKAMTPHLTHSPKPKKKKSPQPPPATQSSSENTDQVIKRIGWGDVLRKPQKPQIDQ